MRFLSECAVARPPDQASRIRIGAAAPLLPFRIDASRMRRCIEELVKNAFEAGARRLEIRVRQGLGKTVIVLEDDGSGLSQGSVAEIARPFFTTRKAEGGFGLGAAIAAAALRAHGGSLRYYSLKDGGLAATLVLPTDPRQPSGGEPRVCALVTSDPVRAEDFLAACENLGVQPQLPDSSRVTGRPSVPTLVDGGHGAPPILSEEVVLRLITGG